MESIQDTTSTGLIDKARTDRTAFAELYRRHYDEIYRYCARRLPCRDTAEDVTSQIFMKMVKNFDTFMGDESAFRCWLYRIACNEINSYYRKSGRHAAALEKLQQEQPTEFIDDPAEKDTQDNRLKMAFLKAAIARLKPEYQDILTLRFYENQNSEQIGETLKMKPATVRSRLSRAIKDLQKQYRLHQQQLPEGSGWYE